MLKLFVNVLVCESANYKKLRNFGENVKMTRSLSWHCLFSYQDSARRQSSATTLEMRLNDVKNIFSLLI